MNQLLGALLVALAATLGQPTPAGAIDVPLDPFEIDSVDRVAEGTVLHKPEDGRLRGYGFSASVTFITDPAWVEKGFVTRSAPEGFKTIAFGLRYDGFGTREEEYPVHGAVIVDGKRIAIDRADYPFEASGGVVFAAAIPNDSKSVEFEMESAGTAQRFSLLDGRRVGDQPAVLYRDPAGPDVTTDIQGDRIVRAEDDQVTAQAALSVTTVRLSWFSSRNPIDVAMAERLPSERAAEIDPITNPSSLYRAFLIIEGIGAGITPDDGPWFDELKGIREQDVKVRLPDGTTIESKLPNPKDGGPLVGRHYFEVPANLTNFTLVVGPTSVDGFRVTDSAVNRRTTVRLEGATWEITLPPGNLPVIPEDEASSPTTAAPAITGDTDRDQGRLRLAYAALGVLAAALVLATVLLLRRRRAQPDAPTGASPTAADAGIADEQSDAQALGTSDVVDITTEPSASLLRTRLTEALDEENVYVLLGPETESLAAIEDSRLFVAVDLASLTAAIDVARLEHARLQADLGDANGHSTERHTLVVAPESITADARSQLAALHRAGAMTLLYLRRDQQPSATAIELDGDTTDSHPADVPVGEAATPAGRVELQLLGAYRILVDGHEVTSGLRNKARELLAYLAVNRDGATADAVIEALLPDYEPDKGQSYFRTIVANARAMLRTATGSGEETAFIARVGTRYRLDAKTIQVDLWRFEDAVARRLESDEQALALYRGPFAEGEDYSWAESVRERVRRRATDSLVTLSEQARDAGDLDLAARAAERAIDCDPYAEELYVRLMDLQESAGRPDAARRTHQAMTRRLAEIGAEPRATTRP